VARLNATKGNVYELSILFRRDRQYFDYNCWQCEHPLRVFDSYQWIGDSICMAAAEQLTVLLTPCGA